MGRRRLPWSRVAAVGLACLVIGSQHDDTKGRQQQTHLTFAAAPGALALQSSSALFGPTRGWRLLPRCLAEVGAEQRGGRSSSPSKETASTADDNAVESRSTELSADVQELLSLLPRAKEGFFQGLAKEVDISPKAASAFMRLAQPQGVLDTLSLAMKRLMDSQSGDMKEEAAVLQKELVEAISKNPDLSASLRARLWETILEAGRTVQIQGLVKNAHLNGRKGVIQKKKKADLKRSAALQQRRLVEVPGVGRLAVPVSKLSLPVFKEGDVVTLHAEFLKDDQALKGRVAVVSRLSEAELNLNMTLQFGLVIVDVLPAQLLPGKGFEPVDRLEVFPETLRPKSIAVGDLVEIVDLPSAPELHGAKGTVLQLVEPEDEDKNEVSDSQENGPSYIVRLGAKSREGGQEGMKKSKKLIVNTANIKLLWGAPLSDKLGEPKKAMKGFR